MLRSASRNRLAVLNLHVARVTQANKIGSHVCLLGCVKFAVRADMMHVERLPDMLGASQAIAMLLIHNSLADCEPPSPPSCLLATDPCRRPVFLQTTRSPETHQAAESHPHVS